MRTAGRKEYRAQSQLLVATPAVLEYLGIDPGAVDPGTDHFADRSVAIEELVIPTLTSHGEIAVANVQRAPMPFSWRYTTTTSAT